MDVRNPSVQRWIFIGLIVFAMVYVYAFTTYLPFCLPVRHNHLRELREQRDDLDRKVREARLAAKALPRLESEVASLRERWDLERRVIPDNATPDEVLREVSLAAQEANVSVTLIKPLTPKPGKLYTTYPATLNVTGRYADLGLFVAKLAACPRLLAIPSMRLTGLDRTTPTANTVAASFSLVSYTMNPGGAR